MLNPMVVKVAKVALIVGANVLPVVSGFVTKRDESAALRKEIDQKVAEAVAKAMEQKQK